MSRELFKRCKDFIELVDIPPPPGFVSLYTDIEVELAKPEPEPVAWLSDRGTIWHDKQDAVDDSDGFVEPLYTAPPDQSAQIAELEKQLEIERMRLAGCGVAAMSNTDESVKARINNLSPFWSASYGDVCAAVDREMSLRKQLADQSARIAELECEIQSLREAYCGAMGDKRMYKIGEIIKSGRTQICGDPDFCIKCGKEELNNE